MKQMSFQNSKTYGFSRLELILWLALLVVLTFILIPFYNSLEFAASESLSNENNNTVFHFESWNQGLGDSNSSED